MASDVIAVVDCDSFFVSCEQRKCSELKNKPVCVLGNNDGCVIARSREAKKLGVKMGMPLFMAKKEFPTVIYLSCDMELYITISAMIMKQLQSYTPNIQQYSIDEAFLNLSGLKKMYKMDYVEIGHFIRNEIKEKLDIPVTVGISSSKTLAKLACHLVKKEGGVFMLEKSHITEELKKTELAAIWGLGRKLVPTLNGYGVFTAYEFVNLSDNLTKKLMGKRGFELRKELLGECVYSVCVEHKAPKSIQKTSSFPICSNDKNYIKNALNLHIHSACKKLRQENINGAGMKCELVGVMLKTKDFHVYYEKKKLEKPTNWELDVISAASELFDLIYNPNFIYRSCGVVLDNLFVEDKAQLSFFVPPQTDIKGERLASCLDNLENKFGKNIVKTGFLSER